MRAWQQTNLTANRANRLEVATIGTQTLIKNVVTHIGLEFFFVEDNNILQSIWKLCAQGRNQLCLYHTESRRTSRLVWIVHGSLKTRQHKLGNPVFQRLIHNGRRKGSLGSVHGLCQLLLHLNDV